MVSTPARRKIHRIEDLAEQQDAGGRLISRVRGVLHDLGETSERKMFGGVGFLWNGNLLVGASKRGLLVRVGKDGQAAALAQPGATDAVMRERKVAGYVRVAVSALDEPRLLKAWLKRAIVFVETLPPKAIAGKPGLRKNQKSMK